jgi:hypothetical protein
MVSFFLITGERIGKEITPNGIVTEPCHAPRCDLVEGILEKMPVQLLYQPMLRCNNGVAK